MMNKSFINRIYSFFRLIVRKFKFINGASSQKTTSLVVFKPKNNSLMVIRPSQVVENRLGSSSQKFLFVGAEDPKFCRSVGFVPTSVVVSPRFDPFLFTALPKNEFDPVFYELYGFANVSSEVFSIESEGRLPEQYTNRFVVSPYSKFMVVHRMGYSFNPQTLEWYHKHDQPYPKIVTVKDVAEKSLVVVRDNVVPVVTVT
jgi:hypothetical protein